MELSLATEVCLLGFFRRSRDWTPGTLITLISFFSLLWLIIHLIEKNHHDDSSGSKVFIFGGITMMLGLIGFTIGSASGGHGEASLYSVILTIVGGFLAAEYLFDYDLKRTIALIALTPVALALSYVAGTAFDNWLYGSLMGT